MRAVTQGQLLPHPVLAVAVGIYLPLELSVPIFVGGLAHFAKKGAGGEMGNHGLLFASGLITGEALIGILLAIPFAAFQSTDVLAIPVPEGYAPVGQGIGVAALLGFSAWLYAVASKKR